MLWEDTLKFPSSFNLFQLVPPPLTLKEQNLDIYIKFCLNLSGLACTILYGSYCSYTYH